jgi:peptidoglycan hydrolase-like protein with peptidoglycan-binding domain
VVTSVIADGSEVGIGTVLYSVESSPVVALPGSLPAWRTLDTSSDDGLDVLQLEMDLTALGYDPDGTMTIDEEFDRDTKAVVKAWQEGYGMEVTGAVALGSVVFVSGETTVAGVDVAVGAEVGDGDSILSLSASSQQVVIDVPDGAEAYMVPGLAVKIGSGDGTVTLLRSIERDGSVVVQAVIAPTAPIEGADNGATVKVTVTTTSLDGVLLVPTEALVSRLDGSYALQVVGDDGTATFVSVELLGVSGSDAGVRGDGLTAGSEVLQPL